MKNYSVELDREKYKIFREYLIENEINFEPSECFNLIHIVVTCNEKQAEKINNFLEVL